MPKVVWTQSRPLEARLEKRLKKHGWESVWCPVITTQSHYENPAFQWQDIDIVYLVSQWSCDYYVTYLEEKQLRPDVSYWTVGAKTAGYAKVNYNINCHYQREWRTSQDVFSYLASHESTQTLLVPISQKSIGKYSVLAENMLPEWTVIEWQVYYNGPSPESIRQLALIQQYLRTDDCLVVASGSAWEQIASIWEAPCPVVSIGPVTSKYIKNHGGQVTFEAERSTYESIVDGIVGGEWNDVF